jgi:hypothetical protein
MKTIALVITILLIATSYTYAGHTKIDEIEKDKGTNEVTVSESIQSENVGRVTTDKNDSTTIGRDADLIDQYNDVYETYRDLDINLGS